MAGEAQRERDHGPDARHRDHGTEPNSRWNPDPVSDGSPSERERTANTPPVCAAQPRLARLVGIPDRVLSGEWIPDGRYRDQTRIAAAQRRDLGDVVVVAGRVQRSHSSAGRHPACMLPHSFAFLAILKTAPMDKSTPMEDTELLTVSQAAEAFSATSQTIRNWIRGDRIKSVRIGNRFLIPRSEVERLRGEISAARGEGTWEHEPGRPPDPLVRRIPGGQPDGDPSNGLLGA